MNGIFDPRAATVFDRVGQADEVFGGACREDEFTSVA